jgi:hypothetical protein
MEYAKWRDAIFGQPVGSDPVMLDLHPETYAVSLDEHFDHVDRALTDPEIHELFNADQIGIGLQLIYSNSCSDICFCYIEAADEERRVSGIERLDNLYANYFDRYCLSPVRSIGNDHLNGGIGYLCYMLWDIFVLYPGNASPAMVTAALDVMSKALQMKNDNCIVSAIHGLGHWAMDVPRATQVLQQWLRNPTTTNPAVISYANEATTGCIL